MDFPTCEFLFETVTNTVFFGNVYREVNVKIHLHHSHATGKIYDYVHDFCNWKVRENQSGYSCIAHNYFGSDFHFMLKGLRISCWSTSDINIGRRKLKNINFVNISSQVKTINTMKYFQASLAQFAFRGTKHENVKFAGYSKTRLFWFSFECFE